MSDPSRDRITLKEDILARTSNVTVLQAFYELNLNEFLDHFQLDCNEKLSETVIYLSRCSKLVQSFVKRCILC